jgi:hypothetical protein
MDILVFQGQCVYYHLLILAKKKKLECWYSKQNASITT